MEKTIFEKFEELYEVLKPKKAGFVSKRDMKKIQEILELKGKSIIEATNIDQFALLFHEHKTFVINNEINSIQLQWKLQWKLGQDSDNRKILKEYGKLRDKLNFYNAIKGMICYTINDYIISADE